MIGIFSARQFVLKTLVIIFLISMTISATPSAQGSWETLMRDDMIRIAEVYATYAWTSTDPRNIEHDNGTL